MVSVINCLQVSRTDRDNGSGRMGTAMLNDCLPAVVALAVRSLIITTRAGASHQ
jgi:hypothetical protein